MIVPASPPLNNLTSLLGSSPLIGSGLVLMVMSSILSPMKSAPGTIFKSIKDKCITSISVSSNSGIYAAIMFWITECVLKGKPKAFRLKTSGGSDYYDGGAAAKDSKDSSGMINSILYQTGEGYHIGWYKRKPVVINISKEKDSQDRFTGKYELHVNFIGVRSKSVKPIIIDAIKYYKSNFRATIDAYFARTDYWQKGSGTKLKTLEALALKGSECQKVLDDVREFLGSKEDYHRYGMTFKRSYLLAGMPGTGKTSLVQAIATNFEMNIYYLDLHGILTASQLLELVDQIPNGSIILFEDIDCVSANREERGKDKEEKDKTGISLSTLLNVLDGLQTREGCVYFLTTNYKDRLDPALIRPGRVDLQVDLGPAVKEQIEELYLKFFPETKRDILDQYVSQCVQEQQVIAKVHQYLINKKFHKDL